MSATINHPLALPSWANQSYWFPGENSPLDIGTFIRTHTAATNAPALLAGPSPSFSTLPVFQFTLFPGSQ